MTKKVLLTAVLALPIFAPGQAQNLPMLSTTQGSDYSSRTAGIQYVASSGNDSNDGLTWATAKYTIYAALEALPNGATNPPTAGTGTVYVADGSRANPIAGDGIWFVEGNTYGSVPAGFLSSTNAAGYSTVHIVGIGCKGFISNGAGGNLCNVVGGGSDNDHPAFWHSGAAPMTIENLGFGAPICMKLAINPNDASGGLVNFVAENIGCNVTHANGDGPGVLIGGNAFNDYFNHIWMNTNPNEKVNISSLSHTHGVTTVTTSSAHPFVTGDKCGIIGANDPSFNGSFPSITVTGANTFTASQNWLFGTSTSSGGYVVCDKGMAFDLDPNIGGSHIGDGLIWITNSEFNGGGIRTWPGSSNNGIVVANVYTDNSITPVVWFGQTDTDTTASIDNVQIADPVNGCCFAVVNDTPQVGGNNMLTGTINVRGNGVYGNCCYGPMTVIADQWISGGMNPIEQGQFGIANGHLKAQTDAARSSPQNVRFQNLAPTSPSSWWVQNGGIYTSGIADRDGGTNAGQDIGVSGSELVFLRNVKTVPAVGDIYICGAWVRAVGTPSYYPGAQGIGYSGGIQPINCPIHGVYTNKAWIVSMGAPNAGDGEWEWMWQAYKISWVGSPGWGQLDFGVLGTPSRAQTGIQAYSPVLLHIPAGRISDGEAANLALNLRGYSNTCAVGQVCDAVGPIPHSFGVVAGDIPKWNGNGDIVDSGVHTAPFNQIVNHIAYSQTPALNLNLGNVQQFSCTTAGASIVPTVSGMAPGVAFTVIFVQNGTTACTWTWPAHIHGATKVSSTLGSISTQQFVVSNNGTDAYPMAIGTSTTGGTP